MNTKNSFGAYMFGFIQAYIDDEVSSNKYPEIFQDEKLLNDLTKMVFELEDKHIDEVSNMLNDILAKPKKSDITHISALIVFKASILAFEKQDFEKAFDLVTNAFLAEGTNDLIKEQMQKNIARAKKAGNAKASNLKPKIEEALLLLEKKYNDKIGDSDKYFYKHIQAAKLILGELTHFMEPETLARHISKHRNQNKK